MIGNETVQTRYKNTNHIASLYKDSRQLSKLIWSNIGPSSNRFNIEAGLLNKGVNEFKIINEAESSNSEPVFDFLDISYQRKLIYDEPFEFYSSIQSSDITYIIDGKNLIVWNISNEANPEVRPM